MPDLMIENSSQLFNLHKNFKQETQLAGYSAAAASFLTVGALIVIGGSSLCLMLPGINAISQVVLPGVLPGLGGLTLCIPLILYCVRKSRQNKRIWNELIKVNIDYLHDLKVDEKENAPTFIKETFFKPEWTKEYASKLISELKERLKDDSNEKGYVKVLDETKKLIFNGS